MTRIALHLTSLLFLAGLAVAEDEKTAAKPVVELKTSKGSIVLELDREKAPVTVANFLKYVEAKHYDGTVFHRVISSFMIQGGGFERKGGDLEQKKTFDGIKNEGRNGLTNKTGTIAMARTNDPDSATNQFFINVQDNPGLDYPSPDGHGYAVFGKVIKGLDVVNTIKEVPTGVRDLKSRLPDGQVLPGRPSKDVPVEDVVIESARVVTGDAGKGKEAAEKSEDKK